MHVCITGDIVRFIGTGLSKVDESLYIVVDCKVGYNKNVTAPILEQEGVYICSFYYHFMSLSWLV